MTSNTASIPASTEGEFQTGEVLAVSAGHFIHDMYSAFIAPLLPIIIEKLSLSLTLAGSLTAIMQIPGLLNPFIGYLAEKVSLRYFVIFAPAVTATLISIIGFAPSYFSLAVILFVAGISSATFHAPGPAMIAEVSKDQVGKGMSLFMAGGELGRTVGPLLAVWAVATWTMDGFYRIVVLGWAASLILFWRLHNVRARPANHRELRELLPFLRILFFPMLLVILFRQMLVSSFSIFLPTFMTQEGAPLWVAGASLSILEVAGVAGALLSGPISDRIGRKPVLMISILSSAAATFLFLSQQGWMLIPTLLLLGFTAFSGQPVLMAVVQDQLPNHRAVGNGLFMSMIFILQTGAIIGFGILGDHLGMRSAFFWSAVVSLLSVPPVLLLPGRNGG